MKNRQTLVCIFLGAFMAFNMALFAWPQQLEVDPTLTQSKPSTVSAPAASSADAAVEDPPETGPPVKPLKASVSQSLYLPPEMYGQWSILFTLVHTDNPAPPRTVHSEIWSLERTGDQVVLANKATGASEAIHVEEVVGNTATFNHYGTEGVNPFTGRPHLIKFERPTLTVAGDKMTGTFTEVYFRTYKDGRKERLFSYVHRVEAERITAGRIQVGPDSDNLEFEIEEIRDERKPKASSVIKPLETIDSTLYAR